MRRLRFVSRLNPSKTEAGDLASYGSVTFAPMDALADGLGGLDTSLERPADELADGSYSYFAEGDLLLAKVTPCFENGKKALVTSLPNRIGFATSEVHVIRPERRKVDPNYLRYLLSSEPFRAAGIASMTGAGGLKRISDNAIKDFQLPISDLDTQKSVAAYLDRETARIDQLITKKERQIQLLSQKLQHEILQAVTLGIDPNVELVPERELEWTTHRPKDWKTFRLKHFFRENTQYSEFGNEILLSLRMREGLIPHNEASDKEIEETDLINYKKVFPGQIVMNRMRAAIGLFGLADRAGIVSPDYSVFDVSPQACAAYFLRRFKTEPMLAAFRLLSKGLGTGQSGFMRLNSDSFGRIRVAVPDLNTQIAISKHIETRVGTVQALQNRLERSSDSLRDYRAALIAAAVTGELDIGDKLPAVTTKPDRAKLRVIVGAEIIHLHPNNPKRARVKVHKITYLAEAHLGIDGLQGNYLREAAGPLDRALREETERGLEAAGYYRANQTDGTGTAVTYTPLTKAGQHKAELNALLGPKADDLRKLIITLADLDRRATEAVTTLYAVWNDALMDGAQPDDATIISGVLNNWHAEKGEKFTATDLAHWLGWMRRHNLIPRGQGPRTKPTMTPRLF
ncbi:hypothetical protein CYK37_30460 [Mesorhizobium loti]|nr:restriction endonuclease subunit S [Mesorhizobium loti]PLP55474.1 hypothetical protein CYK37_30460 [Mesorhizobium loti]